MKSQTAERKFLHDIANPLSTAILLLENILETLRENPAHDPDIESMAVDAHKELERMNRQLLERREILNKSAEEESAK